MSAIASTAIVDTSSISSAPRANYRRWRHTHMAAGVSLDSMSSMFAVSWNGATEVVSWTFYGSNNPSTPFQDLGTIAKFGFETTYISDRFWAFLYAQANAWSGTSLGFSRVEEIILPNRQTNTVTLASLLTDVRRTERRSAVATIVTIVIVLVCLALGGLKLVLPFFWKRPDSCGLPAYIPMRNMDCYAEAGEIEALKYNDGSDSETGTESGNDRHAEEDQQAVPAVKFNHESVPCTSNTSSSLGRICLPGKPHLKFRG